MMKVSALWSNLFPGREINFAENSPTVKTSIHSSGNTEYTAQQMSDGERVALYLAGRVLDSNQGIIIVDEPEVHFHSRLAVAFWNELEKLRPDCRFIYITHDLTFALSRKNAQFIVLRRSMTPEVIEVDNGFPTEIAESLLAAASFSIFARRIIFCEGTRGASIDEMLYSAWFSEIETSVIPVGFSNEVIKCTEAFSKHGLVAGVTALGIVDRDYLPDSYIKSVPNVIHILPVHEIESLLCIRRVFYAIAEHLSISEKDANQYYDEFIKAAKEIFKGKYLNKQISERFRMRCEREILSSVRDLQTDEDINTLRTSHVAALIPETWKSNPKLIFDEEEGIVNKALNSGEDEFLRIFPGKYFWKIAPKQLGLEPDAYLNLICRSLRDEKN